MLKKSIILIFFIILVIYFPVLAEESTSKKNIIDNANIIENETIVQSSLNNFKLNQKIDVFIYTTQKATQEDFEKTMNEYSSLYPSNMILLYFSVENYNVGIFVSDDLTAIVNDANKSLALKSMESFIAMEKYDEAIKTAIDNLNIILTETRKEIDHKVLEFEDKTTQRNISIGVMGLSVLFMLFMFVLLIKDIHKGNQEKKEQELIEKLKKEGKI